MKLVSSILLSLISLISLPIWFYLMYKILIAVQATELMWFLFWIYIPTAFVGVLLKMAFEKEV